MIKKITLTLLSLLALITGCKKSDPEKSGPAVLISKIYYGNAVSAEFTYDGKRLIKVVRYSNDDPVQSKKSTQTHDFSYDSQGRLFRSVISYRNTSFSSPSPVEVLFTYEGDKLHQISLQNEDDHSRYKNIIYTYSDGKLTHCSVPGSEEYSYAYNSKGNHISTTSVFPNNPNHTGTYVTTNLAFDDKPGLAEAMPYALYFSLMSNYYTSMLPGWSLGANNVLTRKIQSTDFATLFFNPVYTYEYNSNGYPSKIKVMGDQSGDGIYTFEYIQAN